MSDVQARIAEVLAEHADIPGGWRVKCRCGWKSDDPRFTPGDQEFFSYADHQAAMLEPLIREAQAEAVQDAANSGLFVGPIADLLVSYADKIEEDAG